ncbi:hypothetical protein ACF0H5_007952 [Mactra antiquata]
MMYTNKRKCDDLINGDTRTPAIRSQSAELLSETSNDALKLYQFSEHDYGESRPQGGIGSPSGTVNTKRQYHLAKRRIDRSRESNLDVDTDTTYLKQCHCDQQPAYTPRLPYRNHRSKNTSPIWKSTPSLSILATNNYYQPPSKEYFKQFDTSPNTQTNARPMYRPPYREIAQRRPWKERSADFLENTRQHVIVDPLSMNTITSPGLSNRYGVPRDMSTGNGNCANPNTIINDRTYASYTHNTNVFPSNSMVTRESALSLEEDFHVNQHETEDIPDSAGKLLENEIKNDEGAKLKRTSNGCTSVFKKSYKTMFYIVLIMNAMLILTNIIGIPLVIKYVHPGSNINYGLDNCLSCDEILLDNDVESMGLIVKSGDKCCLNSNDSPYITLLKIVDTYLGFTLQGQINKTRFPVMQFHLKTGHGIDTKNRTVWDDKTNGVSPLGFSMKQDGSEVVFPRTGSYFIYVKVEFKKRPNVKPKIGFSLKHVNFTTNKSKVFDKVEDMFTDDQPVFSIKTCQIIRTHTFSKSDKLYIKIDEAGSFDNYSKNTKIIMFYLTSPE